MNMSSGTPQIVRLNLRVLWRRAYTGSAISTWTHPGRSSLACAGASRPCSTTRVRSARGNSSSCWMIERQASQAMTPILQTSRPSGAEHYPRRSCCIRFTALAARLPCCWAQVAPCSWSSAALIRRESAAEKRHLNLILASGRREPRRVETIGVLKRYEKSCKRAGPPSSRILSL